MYCPIEVLLFIHAYWGREKEQASNVLEIIRGFLFSLMALCYKK